MSLDFESCCCLSSKEEMLVVLESCLWRVTFNLLDQYVHRYIYKSLICSQYLLKLDKIKIPEL